MGSSIAVRRITKRPIRSGLQKSILRKNSKEYYSFVKTGLDRFENDGNTEEAALNMIKDSISIDVDEIEDLDKTFMRFKKKYDLSGPL